MGHDAVQVPASNKHYHLNSNQCMVLANAMEEGRAKLYSWEKEYESDWSVARKVEYWSAVRVHEFSRELMFRGQVLLDECSIGDPDLWLHTAVKRGVCKESFDLALQDLSDAFIHLSEIYSTPMPAFCFSWKEDLCSAAEKDRMYLLDRLNKTLEAESDHEESELEPVRFLKAVLSADTMDAVKMARQIRAEDLEYGNTLGHGGNAKVVKASWNGIRGFAVKENRVRQHHDKEMHTMLGVSHANVMHLIGYSSEPSSEQGINERNVLLMELMQGGDLDGLLSELSEKGLRSERHLNWYINILLQIARGLQYLHEKKIVHRDLKPANILLDKQPAVDVDTGNFILKIADLGSSRSSFDHVTVATAPVGTDGYMAPEVLRERGNKDVDATEYGPEVDMYSFGMICYKVLTGLDPDLKWIDVLKGKRPPLKVSARCPQALVSFIHKCWDQDADKRPSAAQAYEFLNLFKYTGLLTMPARETSCLFYGITDTLLEKFVSFLGKEWLETEARALEEGTSTEEDKKLREQVAGFLSPLSKEPLIQQKKPLIQQIRSWIPFFL